MKIYIHIYIYILVYIYIGLHVKYPLSLIFMKLEFSRHIAENYSSIKFHENLPNGSRVVPHGNT